MKQIILKPVSSEKSQAGQKRNVFTFLVASFANKKMIAAEAEKIFDVKVKHVATMNYKSTVKTSARRQKSKTAGFKKAMIELAKESKMPLFEEGKKEKK